MEAQAYKLEIFREFLASQGGRIDIDIVRTEDEFETEAGEVIPPSTFFGESITLNEKGQVQLIGYEGIGTPETINKVTLHKKSNVRTYLVETDSQLDGLLTHSEELKSVIDKEICVRLYTVLRGIIDANKDNSSDISIELGRGFTVCEEAVILGDESYNWPVSTLMDIHVPDSQKEVIEATFSDGGMGFTWVFEPGSIHSKDSMVTSFNEAELLHILDAYKQRIDLENTLVSRMSHGSEWIDRSQFYRLTRDMSQQELEALLGRVKGRCLSEIESAQKGRVEFATKERDAGRMSAEDFNDYVRSSLDKDQRQLEGMIHHYANPWTRLAGRMENAIERNEEACGHILNEQMLVSLVDYYSALEEYRPYLDREMKGFIFNKCVDGYLDYTILSPSLRTSELEESFIKDHPYLVKSLEPMFLETIQHGRSSIMGVPPDLLPEYQKNGRITWSSYFSILGGGDISDLGHASGIGFIDDKAYVLFDFNKKAVPFDAISQRGKQAVLESVFYRLKYQLGIKFPPSGFKLGVVADAPKNEKKARREALKEKADAKFMNNVNKALSTEASGKKKGIK